MIHISMKILVAGLVILASTASTAYAVDVITDSQTESIRTNCTNIQASLNQLQQSDTLLRHNRGAVYRTIADKLMIPLNQRISSNQLDGGKLVEIAAKYNRGYEEFRVAFIIYDQSLSKTIAIDCTKQPSTFFDSLDAARKNRLELYGKSNTLITYAKEYKIEFTAFKKQNAKELQTQ